MTRIYLAASLFTLAERRFNQQLAEELHRIEPSLQVFLPQDYDEEFLGRPDFAEKIFQCLMEAIDRCDLVVALLDGADVDSGACIEMGYAMGRGKPVIGVRTDFRGNHDHGLNLMVSGICSQLLTEPSPSASLEVLASRIVQAVSEAKR